MTYTYDTHHNVKTATTEEGLSYSFEYDNYGNNTKVSITGSNGTISSSATYANNGNTLATTTDALGNVTTYGYIADTNELEWVQYPNDEGSDRKTKYTYDEMYRMSKAETIGENNLGMYANYAYDDEDHLASIQTPTSTYSFEYGNFGVRESVSVGNRALASYEYTDDGNNYLKTLAYGNQDSVSYEYDKLGRLTLQTYEDDDTVKYAYDNNGDLATVVDSGSGITTKYYYDLIGRAMKYTETKSGYSHSVEYGYDAQNNLSSQTEIINGTEHNTTYTYDKDNRVTSKVTDNIGVYYTYDSFGRLTQQVTKNNGTVVLTETYTYNAGSAQIASYSTVGTNYSVTYSYTYDANGNILTVSDGTNTTSYVYDSANQVVRENNQAGDYTYTWTYDNAGNIQSKKVYDYTTGSLNDVTPTDTVAYGYTDQQWKDLLTSYDGSDIEYDNIGNPAGYGDKSFTWEHGRELATLTQGSNTWTYTYDANGMRTGRVCSNTYSYEYIYEDSLLTQVISSDGTIYFTYDANGKPLTMTKSGATYTYVTNLQGDVIGLLNSNGVQVVTYRYDAWGNCTTAATDAIVMYNPLLYRGYVYDKETGLYYLQSRYYDPEIGRFINGDCQIAFTDGMIGNNMFSYCINNPINGYDPCGTCLHRFDFWNDCEKCGGDTISDKWNHITSWIESTKIVAKASQTVSAIYNNIGLSAGIGLGLYGEANIYDIASLGLGIKYNLIEFNLENSQFSFNQSYFTGLQGSLFFFDIPTTAGESASRNFSFSEPLEEFIADESNSRWTLMSGAAYLFAGFSYSVDIDMISLCEDIHRIYFYEP